MRDYSKISPQFWTGKTGRALKGQGVEALVVGLYLMTCQHANMLGLYYLSKAYIAVDTGLGDQGASKGLASAIEAGFCQYDEESETVWVMEMAAFQIGSQLDAKDNRCRGVQKEYDSLPENPFLSAFYEKYRDTFHLTNQRGGPVKSKSRIPAPSKPLGREEDNPAKPLRSQEQEQEQEQEIPEANASVLGTASTPPCPHQEIIGLYHELVPVGTQVREWTTARAKALQARWRENPERRQLDWWRKFFEYVTQSDFLTGQASPSPGRDPFVVSLDWLIVPKNFAKVLEGQYHRRSA